MPRALRTLNQLNLTRHTAARAYDRLSRWYDLLSGGAERRLTEMCVAALEVKPGQRVLEIGPGTGHGLITLASGVGPVGRVCGLDLSAGMLSVAGRRVVRAGLQERAGLVRGDGVHLPFAAHSFHAVLMSFTLELFDTADMASVLHECARVVPPGGQLGVVAMAVPTRPNAISRLYAWAHSTWPEAIDCRPIEVASVLADAGWSTIELRHTTIWGLPVALAVATVKEIA